MSRNLISYYLSAFSMIALGVLRADESRNSLYSQAVVHHGFLSWQRAFTPRAWSFPRDHAAHKEFRTEWWYLVSNLRTKEGRRFGTQITFFRHGISSRGRSLYNSTVLRSAWRTDEIHFAHFAVTDRDRKQFLYAERVNRPVLNRAGASDTSLDVWNADWWLRAAEDKSGIGCPRSPFYAEFFAKAEGFSAKLQISAIKPLVLQGHQGLSQKSPEPGNASHYYSLTRLATEGEICIGDETFIVKGWSWFDREFSTSALGSNQRGWDWFAIQLDDNTEIMLYHLRTADGTYDPLSKGVFVDENAATTLLTSRDFRIVNLDTWTSGLTGAQYPSGWNIKIPSLQIDIIVRPLIENQELILQNFGNLSYWEGACEVTGTTRRVPVTGHAYVELTGYSGDITAAMRR